MTITINSIALFVFLQIFFLLCLSLQTPVGFQQPGNTIDAWTLLGSLWIDNWKCLWVYILLSLPQSLGPLTIDCKVWEMRVSFLIYIPEFPAGNSWSLPSTGLLPAITLWLASSPSLLCFLHFLISLSLEHFLNKWPTHKYYS